MSLPSKAEEAGPGEEEHLSPRAQEAYLEKTAMNVEPLAYFKNPVLESQLPRQEHMALGDSQDSFRFQKTGVRVRSPQGKSIMEEILVEGSPDWESAKSPWELESLSPPEWNLCMEDFRKVCLPAPEGVGESGPGPAWRGRAPAVPLALTGEEMRAQGKQFLGSSLLVSGA